MNLFFNINNINLILKKVELGKASIGEHAYLQKVLAAQIVILQYNQSLDKKLVLFIETCEAYYQWLKLNYKNSNEFSKNLRTDFFLLKVAMEKCATKIPGLLTQAKFKPLTHYEILKELSHIWGFNLTQKKESIIDFLKFFLENIYKIPHELVLKIFLKLEEHWKPVLSPIGLISNKKYSLKDIENYFFGFDSKPFFKVHEVSNIDRYFSISACGYESHIFLPKLNDFDIYEASLVIHEFQHVLDAWKGESDSKNLENVYLAEKNALNAERVFTLSLGSSKKNRFCWLESNLFYPILLLKCELSELLNNTTSVDDFSNICVLHNMEPLALSSLFEWIAPFQMSTYCAAAMDLEPNWENYLQKEGSS